MEKEVFCYDGDFGTLHIVMNDDSVWFADAELYDLFEYENYDEAIKLVRKKDLRPPTESQLQKLKMHSSTILISEGGMLTLALNSDSIFADDIKLWITSEVLPYAYRLVAKPFNDLDLLALRIFHAEDPVLRAKWLKEYTDTLYWNRI
jgi:prophage antirepressor-like protein